MDAQNLLLAYPLYCVFEAIFRIGVLVCFAGCRYASWKLLSPHLSMIFSPGYWLAKNCKQKSPQRLGRIALRARLITNYNHWNFYLSIVVFALVIAAQLHGFVLLDITVALLAWRLISRSFEITIAFGNDITTSESLSRLTNKTRMKLAIRSYVEIFFFSAAFYSAASPYLEGLSESMLASLYVGTMTNVDRVAESLTNSNIYPHFVFLQVFATLSLVVLSIAGYLGNIKQRKLIFQSIRSSKPSYCRPMSSIVRCVRHLHQMPRHQRNRIFQNRR